MNLQIFVSAIIIYLSEIRARTLPYYNDIQVICAIIGTLAVFATFAHFLYKRISKSRISEDTKIPEDSKKDSTDSEYTKKETANKNTTRHYNHSTLPEYSEWLKQFVTANRLNELRKALMYLEKHKILLISGVGGVGKSTLVRALVDHRPANIPEPFWFDFSSNRGIAT
jgi:ABC-type glutathione transport system ATPase component